MSGGDTGREQRRWLDASGESRQRDSLSGRGVGGDLVNRQSEFGEQPGVRARVQVGPARARRARLRYTWNRAPGWWTAQPSLSDSSQTEGSQHSGFFQMLQQNKLNLIRINLTQPRVICKVSEEIFTRRESGTKKLDFLFFFISFFQN